MRNILNDLGYGLRMLLKTPGLSLAAIFTIALGIGASIAIFSVFNTVLLRPLPYANPQQLVMVWDNFLRLRMEKLRPSPPEFFDYKQENHSFQDVAAAGTVEFNLLNADVAERVVGARISSNLFSVLGVKPVLGRDFQPGEEQLGGNRLVIVSHGFWQRNFGGQPSALGKTLTLNDNPYTVIGVMPQSFRFPYPGRRFNESADLWVPTYFTPQELNDRGNYSLQVIARLKPDVTLQQANADMKLIAGQLGERYPNYKGPKGADAGWTITVVPLTEEVIGNTRPLLLVLLGAVGFVFLIACANVANLLLARTTGRRKELTVRLALGASRRRIIQQLLTESILLSVLGGVLGLVLAKLGVMLLVSISPKAIPRFDEVGLDASVVVFTIASIFATAIIVGLAPSLRASRLQGGEHLKEGNRGSGDVKSQRMRGFLVVAEIALAFILLVGAGLLLKSFERLVEIDPGLNAQNVLSFDISLPASAYASPQNCVPFYHQLVERLSALPGIKMASMVSALPFETGRDTPFSIDGRPYDPSKPPPVVRFQSAGANYFQTMGIPVKKGRDFTPQDANETSRVVMINETLARTFFPGEDPIGKQIKIGAPAAPNPWLIVSGVVGDVRSLGLAADVKPEMYLPYTQRPTYTMTLVARTDIDPNNAIPQIRKEVQSLSSSQPIYNVRTMSKVIDSSLAERRFSMVLLTVLAFIALLLATVALFGVTYYSVTQRTREIGIRMALGARQGNVLKMIVMQGLKLTVLGTVIGLLTALALTRVLTTMLYNVSATDPLTFAGVALLLAFVALLASYLPARKATKIDPNQALRYE